MKKYFLVCVALFLAACSNCSFDERWDGSDPDLYCYDASNVSSYRLYTVGSHKADAARWAAIEEANRINHEWQVCYDAGFEEEFIFDIVDDYNLSCERIAYINDHLIDQVEERSGGYISSYYRGFFSSHKVEAQLTEYVNTRVLATGELVERVVYHTDCKGKKTVTEDKTYSEADFVMYYVDRCLK